MRIWFIQIGESLPHVKGTRKMRTELLAEECASRGHQVLWWGSAFDHFRKEWVAVDDAVISVGQGVRVRCLKGCGYRKNISLSRFFDHRAIAKKFVERVASEERPDAIIASMPAHDLAFEAVRFAKKNNIPVVVDIRDPWPDIFLSHVPASLAGLFKLALRKDFAMVADVMRQADALTAVSSTFLEWGLRYAGRPKGENDKVFYLGHTNDGRMLPRPDRDERNGDFVVLFLGTLAHYHDPSVVLECARMLRDARIRFVIAGDGEFYNKIKRKSANVRNIEMTGWVSGERLSDLVRSAHIGLCPTTRVIDLFPNKAYTYLHAGLPVLSAFQGDLKDLLERSSAGMYYPPNDACELAKCVRKLYDDRALYQKMASNARGLFDRLFDADKIYREYADYVEGIVRGKRGKS